MEFLRWPHRRNLRVHRRGAISHVSNPVLHRPGFRLPVRDRTADELVLEDVEAFAQGFRGEERGTEKDRQGRERLGEEILEERGIVAPSLEKKPLHAKQIFRSVPSNDEPNPGQLRQVYPVYDPTRQHREMPLRRLRRRRQRAYVCPYVTR